MRTPAARFGAAARTLSTALSTGVSTAVSTVADGLRHYAADLRASRAFLASEVSHGGWLDLGQFRWRDATRGRAARAAFGVVVPLAIGMATGHVEYGTFAALGAQPAGWCPSRA